MARDNIRNFCIIAHKTDTISYEVLCGVSRRVPRVYLEHGTTAAVEDWILND